MKRFLAYVLPPVLYAGLIVYLSSRSSLPGPPLAHGLDKVAHFTEYALLALLTARALRAHGVPHSGLVAWAAALLFGATDEVHQLFTAGRSSDVLDWLADGLGAAAGAFTYSKLAGSAFMTLRPFKGRLPDIHPTAFIEDSAQLIGDVTVGASSSIWFNCVVRGDVHSIRVGQRTNIQDLSMVHVTNGRFATSLGDDVTVGHHVVLHGCTVGSRVLVGMGAILMDDVEVGDDCMIGAGALVTPGTKIPPGVLAMGSPARVIRPLKDAERAFLLESSQNYVRYAQDHLASR